MKWTESALLPGVARQSVAAALGHSPAPPPKPAQGFLAEPHPVFVTIHTHTGQMRGCVGTLTPKFSSVIEETWRVARSAAFEDGRFEPVRAHEMPGLDFEVSVLHELEPVQSEMELDPATYGVLVTTPDGRHGVLLPALESVTSIAQQLDLARRKAGIEPGEPVALSRFRVTKVGEKN